MATPLAEINIDEDLIRVLLSEQHPALANLPLEIIGNGWDNVIARLGSDLTVRLPRRQLAAPLIGYEQHWLPQLAVHLPLPIPQPVLIGVPSDRFPWAWSICHWLPGNTVWGEPLQDPNGAATSIAQFLVALHVPAPADAPINPYRGGPLGDRTEAVQQRSSSVATATTRHQILQIWPDLVATPAWNRPAVWLHGDLHPANILSVHGHISAIIDFGDITSGDPATDLAVAWMLFEAPQRQIVRRLAGVDDDTWTRAAGWAIHLSLAYLTADESTVMPAIGRATLAKVLDHYTH